MYVRGFMNEQVASTLLIMLSSCVSGKAAAIVIRSFALVALNYVRSLENYM